MTNTCKLLVHINSPFSGTTCKLFCQLSPNSWSTRKFVDANFLHFGIKTFCCKITFRIPKR